MASSTPYELVVFGATGYTGKLTAEHIAKALPTDLKWALAGRSESKLKALANELKSTFSNRIQPGIEICNLNDEDLAALARKTKLIIATVGPYGHHGEHAFKACAENGTHYLDVTGEVPFVADMIKKYENIAKKSGSIMLPQIGLESAPPDLVAWSLVNMIKQRFSAPTAEVTVCVHEITSRPSGGTLHTVLSFFDCFSLRQIQAALAPYALSPVPAPKPKTNDPISWITKIFGVRLVPELGTLTTALFGSTDTAIVQRSWGQLGYGPNFRYYEYMRVKNYFAGIVTHFALVLGGIFLVTPLLRNIVKKLVYQPGDGPTAEEFKNDKFEYRGIAIPDVETPNSSRAFCKVSFQGSLYVFTGLALAEAAITILRDDHDLPGGIYTAASLGQKFIDRLDRAGLKFEKSFYELDQNNLTVQ